MSHIKVDDGFVFRAKFWKENKCYEKPFVIRYIICNDFQKACDIAEELTYEDGNILFEIKELKGLVSMTNESYESCYEDTKLSINTK